MAKFQPSPVPIGRPPLVWCGCSSSLRPVCKPQWAPGQGQRGQTEQKGGVAQPGQPVSGARFEKRLRGHAMTEEVVGRNLGIVPADLAPDVVDPGGQIVFVDRASGRVAESVGGVMVGLILFLII